MKTVNYAAIDIGSNAARLLIKKVETDGTTPEFTKQLFLRVPLRLGFDVFRDGRVSDTKAKRMERLMKAYRQLMKIYDVDRYRACATSAMRDAANGPKLIENIFKDTGIQIEIIAGEEEAGIVYNNHVEQLEDRDGNYIYVDVGGGSTEINLLTNGELVCSRSYNVGTIRILNGGVDEAAWQRMRDELAELAAPYGDVHIIGSGGNINKLYRLTGKKDKKRILTIEELRGLYEVLNPLTPEQRMAEYKLKADRADVIVPAAEIFLTVAAAVRAKDIVVPVIGLCDGIIDTLYKTDFPG